MNTENREDLQQLVGDGYQLQWIIGHGGMSTFARERASNPFVGDRALARG